MSKYSLLSVFITNVAVVAILTASISAAHPGSPPPDRTASGQRFATAAFLVSLHGLWPDIRVCTLSGQLFCGMPTQTADNADSLSDNPDDHLHAPPVYNGLFDPRSKVGGLAKRFFDVACHGAPACEPKRARTISNPRRRANQKRPPRPEDMVVGAIEQVHAKTLPAPASPKPDAPPQGDGGNRTASGQVSFVPKTHGGV